MKTIEKVLEDFLREQKAWLKPKTYRGYKSAIELFKDYLNSYAYLGLDEEDSQTFDELYNKEGKEFCQIFEYDKIDSFQISEFLGYFMIRKVMGSKELMKTVARVMRRFAKWMREKDYINEEKYEMLDGTIDDFKDDLPKVVELSDLIYEYIQCAPPVDFTDTVEGYFTVVKIQPGKLWLEDYSGQEEKIGPVSVPDEISSLCKEGWTLSLKLDKTKKGWQILESGNVYPE